MTLMVEGYFCYDGDMLTKTDKGWIKQNNVSKDELKRELKRFATKEDLSVARIDLKTEMAKMEHRIEEKAQIRHDELLNLFDGLAGEVKDNEEFRLVANHRLDRLEAAVGVIG